MIYLHLKSIALVTTDIEDELDHYVYSMCRDFERYFRGILLSVLILYCGFYLINARILMHMYIHACLHHIQW